jgi:hypothetical protein
MRPPEDIRIAPVVTRPAYQAPSAKWLPDGPRIPRAPTDTSRPPGVPYGADVNGMPKPEAQLLDEFRRALDAANSSGDMSTLNAVDNFRQTLTPELQAEYDKRLAALRSDPRIRIVYKDGAQPNPALEDMTLRGMVAATFGNPAIMNKTIDKAVAANDTANGGPQGDGHLTFEFYPGLAPNSEGKLAWGWAMYGEGTIRMDASYTASALSKGDSVPQHEFSHFMQGYNPPEGSSSIFPGDFPFEEAMLRELADAGFGKPGGETWPDLQNRFRQYPEKLAAEHPAIYRMMVEYAGYDPLTQSSSAAVRLDGSGNIGDALTTLRMYFGSISSDGRLVTEDDLRALLANPDASLPSDVRAAAAYLLSSPTARYLLDTGAGRGNVNGAISRSDIAAAQDIVNSRDYAYAVLDTASGRGGRDHYISAGDIKAALADPGLSPEVRSEIGAILIRNPFALFTGIRYA